MSAAVFELDQMQDTQEKRIARLERALGTYLVYESTAGASARGLLALTEPV